MAVIDIGDGSLGYDERGTGAPLVLSHAGIADRRMWTPIVDALAADRRVVRYDWRGYGESSDATGLVTHYRDLLALMDALQIESADLVGCSMGGGYALEAALAAPERVRSLTLICAGLPGHAWPPEMLREVTGRIQAAVPAERIRAYQAGAAEDVRSEDVDAVAEVYARYMVAGPDRDASLVDPGAWDLALQMLRGVFAREWATGRPAEQKLEPSAHARLGEVRAPTLVISGVHDVRWIRDVSGLLADGIPGARRRDVDAGHLPPIERPRQIAGLVLDHTGT